MTQPNRRAVITGLGVVTPIGIGVAAFWDALAKGRSGIGLIEAFDASALPTRIAGEVRDFDAKNFVDKKDRKSLKMMSRGIQLAVAASQLAMNDAGVAKDQLDPTRFGLEFGAGLISSEIEELAIAARASTSEGTAEVDLETWGTEGLAGMPPLWMLKYLPNMLACHVSLIHNAQGPNNSITENDVAGLLAMGEAFRILKRDHADFFLVGGADGRIDPLTLIRQCLFMPLSKRNDEPQKASRPFDRDRDGIVPGEGGCVIALEDFEHARRRGARIYAEVVGFGAAFDRGTGAGLARAMRAALAEAGASIAEVDHVNAHGFSDVRCDRWEAQAIHEVFGARQKPVPVLAVKSYMGSLAAGAGTAELAASVLALEHAQLPPTLNFEKADPACPVHVAAGGLRPTEGKLFLKTSITEMGQCAALVVRKL
jgi:3-oxoacyl-[acyl-carrier-protein] synthase II